MNPVPLHLRNARRRLLPTALGGERYIEVQPTGVEAEIRQGFDAVEAEKAKGSKKDDAKDSRIESVNFLMFHAGRAVTGSTSLQPSLRIRNRP